MTVLTVTLDFASDDGTAELFVSYYSSGDPWPDGSYDGGEGNPSGSVTSSLSYPSAGFQIIGFSRSIADWGVPAGATINSVGNLLADYKAVKTGSYAYDPFPLVELRKGTCVVVGGNTIAANYPPDPFTGVFNSWEALPQQDTADLSPYDTDTLICVGLYLDGNADVSGSSIAYWYDNISFDIDYTAGSDVELTGNGTQRRQEGDGTLIFSGVVLRGTGSQRRQSGAGTLDIVDLVDCRLIGHGTQRRAIGFGGLSLDDSILIYGSGSQRRQSGIGTLFSPIAGEVSALSDAGIRFVLTIDGDEYPLMGAVIQRNRNSENASVTIPGAITWAILATVPTNLAIDLSRLRLDGSAVETINLFTGIIDLSLASLNGLTGELVANGSAIYPTRENRRLTGSPSYVRDSSNQVAVRGQIDPYLVPGDVLRFSDVREIAVSKVVYNINPNLMFMEASSGI